MGVTLAALPTANNGYLKNEQGQYINEKGYVILEKDKITNEYWKDFNDKWKPTSSNPNSSLPVNVKP